MNDQMSNAIRKSHDQMKKERTLKWGKPCTHCQQKFDNTDLLWIDAYQRICISCLEKRIIDYEQNGKKCSYCGNRFEANVDNFHNDPRSRDGLKAMCKTCYQKKQNEYKKTRKNNEAYN